MVKNKLPKYIIHKDMDKNLINMINKHVDKIDTIENNKKISKIIFNYLQKSLIESFKIKENISECCDMKPLLYNKPTKFMPQIIIQNILDVLHLQYDISFQYKNINFYIHIVFSDFIDVQNYIKYIKWIICFCLLDLNNKNKQVIRITLYLTNLKKSFDNQFEKKILPIHVNSGFTRYNDNETEICIYRKEEWLKVLIHECFHAFNMDFHEGNINFKNLFKDIFFVHSDFLIFECFVEFWARIINCGIFTYLLKKNISYNEFNILFNLNLNMERIFSLIQCNKILNIFDLNYNYIIDKNKEVLCKKMYKEDTNSFCYYIITSILMNSFDKTLQWFNLHNKKIFYFNKSEREVIIFSYYIKQLAKNNNMINVMNELQKENLLNNYNLNMILFDIQIS